MTKRRSNVIPVDVRPAGPAGGCVAEYERSLSQLVGSECDLPTIKMLATALSQTSPPFGVAVAGKTRPILACVCPALIRLADQPRRSRNSELKCAIFPSATTFGKVLHLEFEYTPAGILGDFPLAEGDPVLDQLLRTDALALVVFSPPMQPVQLEPTFGVPFRVYRDKNLGDPELPDGLVEDPRAATAVVRAYRSDGRPPEGSPVGERLILGWWRHYRYAVERAAKEGSELTGRSRLRLPDDPDLDRLLALAAGPDRVRACFAHLRHAWGTDPRYLFGLAMGLRHVVAVCQPDEAAVGSFLARLLDAYLCSSWMTDCGREECWLDPESGTVARRRIAPDRLPAGLAAEDYWPRLPTYPLMGWHLAEPEDAPFDVRRLEPSGDDLPAVVDPAEAERVAAALLHEAAARKAYVIPPGGADVDLPGGGIGPFRELRLAEYGAVVVGLLRTPGGECLSLTGYTGGGGRVMCDRSDDPEAGDPEWLAGVEAAIKLWFAGVVRDFWVLETRERTFHPCPGPASRPPAAPSDRPALPARRRFTLLPRVRYVGPERLDACSRRLGLRTPAPHAVAGHLRRVRVPGPHQLTLAEGLGVSVPEGYTFVRPHRRGGGGENHGRPVYRCRSAVQLLSGHGDSGPGPTPASDWFQFERDLHSAAVALGLEVRGLTAHRGIDALLILAARPGDPGEPFLWLCACPRESGAHDTAAVATFVRLVRGQPAVCEGVFVTTGSFAPEAVEAAAREGVRLIDGRELAALAEAGRTRVGAEPAIVPDPGLTSEESH